ncbi:MAG: PilZ domain-containing protein [Acidobacteria bacterium]|nr:PilZ domain-containing protein [Acidobacteriota bacterium]
MKLNALILCRNHASLRVLATALDAMDVEHETQISAQEAMEALARGFYSAVVVDFDVPGAVQVAQLAHMLPARRKPVVFAMIGALTSIAGVLQTGANFVLYKPLILEQVERSLRAARGFLHADRRRSARHKVTTLAHLRLGKNRLTAIVLEVSEQALSLQAPEPIPASPQIAFQFPLPGTDQLIEGTGEMLWADDAGRCALLFTALSAASQKRLRHWLAKQGKKPSRTLLSAALPTRAMRRSAVMH